MTSLGLSDRRAEERRAEERRADEPRERRRHEAIGPAAKWLGERVASQLLVIVLAGGAAWIGGIFDRIPSKRDLEALQSVLDKQRAVEIERAVDATEQRHLTAQLTEMNTRLRRIENYIFRGGRVPVPAPDPDAP